MKIQIIVLIILLTAGLTGSRAQDTWTQKADFGGLGRSTAIGFSIGDKGYIGMGANGTSGLLLRDFWEYDPVTDAWTQKADFGGDARGLAVGLSINGKGYVGLGTTRVVAGPVIYYKDFWEYDPENNIWTQKADFGGAARAYAAGFAVDGKVYIGAGSAFIPNEVFYPDFWQYDPSSDTWTQKADFGERTAPTTFAIGDKGYMGLGFKFTGSWWQTDFYEYDLTTDIWTKKADFPGSGRESPARFVIGSKGYLGPGYGHFTNINDFWEYDAALDQWTQKNDFGGPDRAYAVGFSTGMKGYIGTGGNSGGDLKDFWEYTPGTGPSCIVPSGMTTTDITGTSAKLYWDDVAEAKRYKIHYKVAGTSDWTKVTDVKSNSIIISGLTPNTLYYWEVKSVCSANPIVASDWSAKASFTTGAFKMGDEPAISLELYPNPTPESFILDLQLGTTTDQSADIFLLNELGQMVYSEKAVAGNGELKKEITMPSAASSGWYIVRVVLSDQVMERKLLYQK